MFSSVINFFAEIFSPSLLEFYRNRINQNLFWSRDILLKRTDNIGFACFCFRIFVLKTSTILKATNCLNVTHFPFFWTMNQLLQRDLWLLPIPIQEFGLETLLDFHRVESLLLLLDFPIQDVPQRLNEIQGHRVILSRLHFLRVIQPIFFVTLLLIFCRYVFLPCALEHQHHIPCCKILDP